MSSSILYKFRSGTTFEALPLPGSAARLLDIKKAIVTAKKLDQGSMDFDLSVKDASSGVEYQDESALLPRGTRLIVHRLPAQRGQGILAKIARSQQGGGYSNAAVAPQQQQNPSDFYTIDSRAHDEDEEFVSSSVPMPQPPADTDENKDEQELARLQAFIETEAAVRTGLSSSSAARAMMRGGRGGGGPAGSGPPPRVPPGGSPHFHAPSRHHHARPNADPELREQEVQLKKRPTGIPRTFQSLTAPPNITGEGGGVAGSQIQPNAIGFEELVQRGGGQSENATGTKRDLEYAIKVTATTVPEYLQCAICHEVVRDAMMLPWDTEGRTVCERCIRDALTQNGFCCPLTHKEGCSPDDLLPNHALRKAANQFIQDVVKKIQEIEDQAKLEEDILVPEAGGGHGKVLEGDMADGGVVLTRRASAADQKRKKEEEDPFGGEDDDFGGDVFDVAAEKEKEMVVASSDDIAATTAFEAKSIAIVKKEEASLDATQPLVSGNGFSDYSTEAKVEHVVEAKLEVEPSADLPTSGSLPRSLNVPINHGPSGPPPKRDQNDGRRDESHHTGNESSNKIALSEPFAASRRSRLPAGYTMGPAGGAVEGSVGKNSGNSVIERAPSAHPPRDTTSMDRPFEDRSYRGGGGYRGGRSAGHGASRFDSTPRGGGRGGFYQNTYSAPRNDVSL